MQPPTVSIIIVNWNGRHLLETCLPSVEALTYPRGRVDVLVFDNGSTDGSRQWLASTWPRVRILEHPTNLGFAGASTAAAAASQAEIVAFVNNDVRLAPAWLTCMVEALQTSGAAAAGSRILDWDGRRFDFDGAAMNFHGHGTNRRHGHPYRDDGAAGTAPNLFACGAAMIADRAKFLASGGFDPDYFAYFEDVDFGWRLWVEGETVVHVPGAVAYHRHHGSALDADRRTALLEKNALATLVKNYDQAQLRRVLPIALVLVEARARAAGESRAGIYRGALVDFLEALPALLKRRAAVQARRRRADRDILPLFREPFRPSSFGRAYWEEQQRLVRACGIAAMFGDAAPAAGGTDDFIADLEERIETLERELDEARRATRAAEEGQRRDRARLEHEIARLQAVPETDPAGAAVAVWSRRLRRLVGW